jgi:hypothetical protein
VFSEPSTIYQTKYHSLVAVVAAASAVSFWGAASRPWHVPRCGGAAAVRRGLILAWCSGAAVEETLVRGNLERTKERFAPISYSIHEVVVYR